MTTKDFLELAQQTFDECFNIIKNKNHDYSDKNDPFSNFKFSGKVAGITPEQAALNLIGTKLARLNELITNSKSAKNESIEDSILDAINYLLLLRGMIVDSKI